MKYTQDTHRLIDIENAGRSNWLRIYCNDMEVFAAYPDCWTYIDVDANGNIDPEGDYEVDALGFVHRDGSGCVVAGIEIDHFEILEKR